MRQLGVNVSVSYGTDLVKAKNILQGIMENNEKVIKRPAPYVYAKQFGQYSIDFELQFWAAQPEYWNELKGEIITAIDKTFKAEGIEIPVPRQDLQLRSHLTARR